eukprot:2165066-Amphidinium_carterae.1
MGPAYINIHISLRTNLETTPEIPAMFNLCNKEGLLLSSTVGLPNEVWSTLGACGPTVRLPEAETESTGEIATSARTMMRPSLAHNCSKV